MDIGAREVHFRPPLAGVPAKWPGSWDKAPGAGVTAALLARYGLGSVSVIGCVIQFPPLGGQGKSTIVEGNSYPAGNPSSERGCPAGELRANEDHPLCDAASRNGGVPS